jgi:hypothetical protein
MGKLLQMADDRLSELVDQLAPLRILRDAFSPTENEYQRVWEKIKPLMKDRAAGETLTLKGKCFEIELTECATERRVKPLEKVYDALKKLFGAKRYYSMLGFPVTPIDALVGKPIATAEYMDETQTGARKFIRVTDLRTPAKAAKAA